jgi:threonine dehydrogenase-like Zn-dependent dehydrogenase
VATSEVPLEDVIPHLLAHLDDCTGWFAGDAADVKPGMTVAVVGDGAVGLFGVLSAKKAWCRADHRDKPLRSASGDRPRIRRERHRDRGDEAVARVKEITAGIAADAVLECVGTQESIPARPAPTTSHDEPRLIVSHKRLYARTNADGNSPASAFNVRVKAIATSSAKSASKCRPSNPF